jgi:hypothetical protein
MPSRCPHKRLLLHVQIVIADSVQYDSEIIMHLNLISHLRFVFSSIRRFGTHPQPTPPLFEPLRLTALAIIGDCSGQTKRSRPPTGPFGEAGCPGSLSAPRSSAQIRDLVFHCTGDVEEHVVDDEYGPWADGKKPEEDLVDLVSRIFSKR